MADGRQNLQEIKENCNLVFSQSLDCVEGKNTSIVRTNLRDEILKELPIESEPKDVVDVVDSYARWLSTSPIPKLFINAEPAALLAGAPGEFCRA